MSEKKYNNTHLDPGEDDKAAWDEGYYHDYCHCCKAETEHEDNECLKCFDKTVAKKMKVKPHLDRFLANDPIDW